MSILSHFSNTSGSDLPSFSPSHSPGPLFLALPGAPRLNVPNSLVAPGEKRQGFLAKGVQKGTGYLLLLTFRGSERLSARSPLEPGTHRTYAGRPDSATEDRPCRGGSGAWLHGPR